MDINELNKKHASLIAEAKALAGKENPSPDDLAKVTELLGKADEAKALADTHKRIAEGEEYGEKAAGTTAAHLGFRQAGVNEGESPVDEKSWRSVDVMIPGHYGMEKKTIRYNVPLSVQKKGYEAAFEAYLRKGKADMGPNDRKTLSEAVDTAGGYTVPDQWLAGLIAKQATMATVRNYARVVQASRDLIRVIRRKYNTNNEYTSGVRMTWTGESPAASTTARVTDQTYGEIAIPVNTALATQLVSFDLLEDNAYDVMGDSMSLFAEAFTLGENDVFWNGHGAGQPRGILTSLGDTTNWPNANVTDTASASTLTADELIEVAYGLPSQYENGARWFWAKATELVIRKLTDTNGDYMWPVWAQRGNFSAPDRDLEGYPITRDEAVPSTADATDGSIIAVLGNLNGYMIVDRVGLSVQRFDEVYAETNTALLLGRKRVGGQLLEDYKFSCYRYQTST
jgi:HK97 family phage major capsid protein